MNFARAVGYKKITLWTQRILLAAHHLYQKEGFHLVEEKPNLQFGRDLVSQTWELDLTERSFGRAAGQTDGTTDPTTGT